jgi:hypothetical protein
MAMQLMALSECQREGTGISNSLLSRTTELCNAVHERNVQQPQTLRLLTRSIGTQIDDDFDCSEVDEAQTEEGVDEHEEEEDSGTIVPETQQEFNAGLDLESDESSFAGSSRLKRKGATAWNIGAKKPPEKPPKRSKKIEEAVPQSAIVSPRASGRARNASSTCSASKAASAAALASAAAAAAKKKKGGSSPSWTFESSLREKSAAFVSDSSGASGRKSGRK